MEEKWLSSTEKVFEELTSCLTLVFNSFRSSSINDEHDWNVVYNQHYTLLISNL